MTTEHNQRTATPATNGNGVEDAIPQAPLMPRPDPQLEQLAWRSTPDERPTGRPRVVIVGAGFGGITATQRLAGRDVDVLLIDRNNYHGFWPLLYQVALSGLEAESIAYPVRAVIQGHDNLHFRLGTVVGVDFDARQVKLDGGDSVGYDYLVLAAGSANNYFGNDKLAQQTYGLKDLDDALALRNAILEAFESAANTEDPAKQQQLLTFAIIGGGPTGVELAGTLAELVKYVLRKDFPQLDTTKVRIVVIEASKDVLGPFSPGLRRNAMRQLERRGVELRLGQPVTAVENGVVTFKDGSTLPAKTVVWAAGVRAAALADVLGVEQARGARVKVTPTLQLPNHPEVYVIGDMAYLEGFKGDQAYPMVAPVAMQMAKTAVYNILATVHQRSTKHFSYFDKGSMATIGRRSAVFESFGIRMTGLLAWLGWLFVHLIMLIGFRNRLVVLLNWFWNYITFDGGTRLIIRRKYQYTRDDKASTDDPSPGTKQPGGQQEAEFQREAGYQAQATTL
jgi:NADH:ubiquinone reductase (H+-translocating)